MTNLATALHQLRQERTLAQRHVEKLGEAIHVIEGLVGGRSTRGGSRPEPTLSAAARRKISHAQKARWAKLRGQSNAKSNTLAAASPKRTISPAGRRRIAAAQRARWAKLKRQEKKAA